jgi:hypothetical protein
MAIALGFGTEKLPGPGPSKQIESSSHDAYRIPSKLMEGLKARMQREKNKIIDVHQKNNYPSPGASDTQNLNNMSH